MNDDSTSAVLIRAYGEYWNPELVDWKSSWKLLGLGAHGKIINMYEQRGVYVLYEDYIPVYIGKADKQSIGYRLQLHRDSELKGPRWDSFSWFGLNRINRNGNLGVLKSNNHVKTTELISTFEALLILIANPKLNSKRERLKNAIRISQSGHDKPLSEIEKRLQSIEQKLDSLMAGDTQKS